jgi:hypothetical protein
MSHSCACLRVRSGSTVRLQAGTLLAEALRPKPCCPQDIEGRPSMVGKVNVLQQASMAAAAQGSKASCCTVLALTLGPDPHPGVLL